MALRIGALQRIYDPSVGEHQPWYINDHCFIHGEDGVWHMYGITHAEPACPLDETCLAHATTPSLTRAPWVKQPFALQADRTWHETHLWAPHVIHHAGLYWMYYCAGGVEHARYRIHVATSTDLWHWTRHAANPMVVDGFDARDPMVLQLEDQWLMYYTATSQPAGGKHVVACVTSRDLVHWGNKRHVFVDATTGTAGGPCESPFVVRRGVWFYLFIGPREAYSHTVVYRSADPFHWTIAHQVAEIPAHAVEVVIDRTGQEYVSHCGWGQGGLYLAPLHWHTQEDGCR
jgi:sucrose-6-phosphate hydrolase SacC (GH32 family)